MNDALPTVTVLIAARPDQAEIKAVIAGKQLNYPRDRMEMIVARGKQPSIQRNAGIRAAKGDIIYFLDDDSMPPPGCLRRAAAAFADPAVQMIGGPNLCPADAPPLEQVFALVHASWLAFFSSRARYARVGALRSTSEKELILCNLAARRAAVVELGGFDELLYPNEENALMDALARRGKLIYDPEMFVYRRPRRTLKAFVKMLWNYGRGRAEQVRLHPTIGSAPNFVPPMLCVYLLVLPLLCRLAGPLALIPLGCYLAALFLQAAVLAVSGGPMRALGTVPFIFLTHAVYGAGFARGLLTRLKPPAPGLKSQVVLETVPL